MRPAYKPLAQDKQDRIKALRAQGMSITAIGLELGISKSVVYKYCTQKPPKPKPEPVRIEGKNYRALASQYRWFGPLGGSR